MAKVFFKENNIEFSEKDVTVDAQARETLIQKSGQLGVPVITVDDAVVVGFDRAKLSQLLGIK